MEKLRLYFQKEDYLCAPFTGKVLFKLCGCGEIGRHARLRI